MNRSSVDPSFSIEARGRRFLARWGALLATLLLAAGCTQGQAGISAAPTASISPTQVAATFPLTLTDDEGTSVAITAEPRKIVTLTAASTETVFALGLASRVVGTDSASDFPPEAVPLPDVGAFGAVDVEKIIGLHADLVIAGGNGDTPPDGIAKLRSLNVPVVVVYASTVDAVTADVELIGRATGHPAEGMALAQSMRDEIKALAAAVTATQRPRVFYEIDASNQIYGPADRSFLTEMLSLAGADPITSGSQDSYEFSLERLVAADPEVIVLGDAAFGVAPDVVEQRPGWAKITAVRLGDIRPVDDKLITRPGPRLAQGLRSLILAIHPDAHLP